MNQMVKWSLPIMPKVKVIVALTSPKYTWTFHTTYTMRISREHYNGVIMGEMASQIASLPNVYITAYSGTDQRNHQSSASLASVNSPYKRPEKCFHLMTSSWKCHVFKYSRCASSLSVERIWGQLLLTRPQQNDPRWGSGVLSATRRKPFVNELGGGKQKGTSVFT